MFPHCYSLCVSVIPNPPDVNPSTSLDMPCRLTPCTYLWLSRCTYLWLSELEQPCLEDLEAVLQEVLVLGRVDDLDVVADLRHERQLRLHVWRKGEPGFRSARKGRGCNAITEGPESKASCIMVAEKLRQKLCKAAFERASAFWLSLASGGACPLCVLFEEGDMVGKRPLILERPESRQFSLRCCKARGHIANQILSDHRL
jgi:hypothetical protein